MPHGAAGPMCNEHRHDVGPGPLVDGIENLAMNLAVNSTVDGVNQAVALTAARGLEKRACQEFVRRPE